jgi:hypothetical protein
MRTNCDCNGRPLGTPKCSECREESERKALGPSEGSSCYASLGEPEEYSALWFADKIIELETKLRSSLGALAASRTNASIIQSLLYGADGDCGAVRLASQIEEWCDAEISSHNVRPLASPPLTPQDPDHGK